MSGGGGDGLGTLPGGGARNSLDAAELHFQLVGLEIPGRHPGGVLSSKARSAWSYGFGSYMHIEGE